MSGGPASGPATEPFLLRRGRSAAARLPRLVLVPSPHRRSRLPFALVVVLLLGSGLIGLLLLNTVLAQDAFVLYQLRQQTSALHDREQQLREAVARAEAPTVLASRATSLGMVPGGDPLFLRLPDGAVLGDPTAAMGSELQPTARASISPTPAPAATATPAPRRIATPAPMPTAKPTAKPALKPTARPTPKATPRPSGGRP